MKLNDTLAINRSRRHLQDVIAQANRYVQTLNDKFTDPSGELLLQQQSVPAPETPASVIPASDRVTAMEEPQEPVRYP